MPKLLKPGSRLTLILECDKDDPVEKMPKFFGRSLSVDGATEMLRAVKKMDEAETWDKPALALDCVMYFLVGWENMNDPATGEAIPFERQELGKILTFSELREVINFAMDSFTPTGDDQKKSESPPS